MRPVQYFSDDYLAQCREMTADQILRFLEDFRTLHLRAGRSRLISLKVPESLLAAFKVKAGLDGIPYQSQIKRLMAEWLESSGGPDS